MSSVVDDLVYNSTLEVRRFAISGLANLLFKHVEHDSPRDLVDWDTAKDFIDVVLNEEELIALTKQYLILSAYEGLRQERKELASVRYDLLSPEHQVPGHLGYTEQCRTLTSVLSALPKEKMISLTRDIDDNERNRRLDLILGRPVWEFYQTLIHSDSFIHLLFEGNYGKILQS